MKKVGIVGGGQLGRMMAMESKDLDIEVTVLDPTPNCPASKYAKQVVGDFADEQTVLAFGKDKDVLTFEIESANAEALQALEESGKEIHPSPKTLSIIKDKFAQKEFLVKNNIPVAPCARFDTIDDIKTFAAIHGYPLVLKSRFGSYDGRGNRTIKTEEEIGDAQEALGENLYVEAWVPFEKELAVVSARDTSGTVYSYPVVETIHVDHICDTVISPADVSKSVSEKAAQLAQRIMEIFHGAGVFGIEMFVTKEDEVLINEIAPRVHNSGHHTLAGFDVSQFRQHMCAVSGESILNPKPFGAYAVMKNILGEQNQTADPKGIEDAEALGAHVEIYGKHDTKIKRKMGHLTVVSASLEEALCLATEARKCITI